MTLSEGVEETVLLVRLYFSWEGAKVPPSPPPTHSTVSGYASVK